MLARRDLLRGLALLPALPTLVAPRRASAFTPPSPEARAAAIGPLDRLSAPLRTSLTPDLEDLPIPRPGPGDWLSEHREADQTHDAYLRGGFNRPDERRRTIVVQPIGELGEAMPAIADLVDFAGRFFQLPARSEPSLELEVLRPGSRPRGRRRQYLSGDILDALKWRLPGDAYCMIAVTAIDLYPGPKWNFVFGEARFRERVGVHSFIRYDPAFYGQARGPDGPRRILRRGLKVMAHEIGHMFSMSHCTFFHCVMNGTNNLEETDRSPVHLCPVCRRKLHSAVGYDPRARESALAEFYRAHALPGPAERHDRRVAEIDAASAAAEKLAVAVDHASAATAWIRRAVNPWR
ncbi:MAG: archaemetzincin [Nannocystaceae bacterium]